MPAIIVGSVFLIITVFIIILSAGRERKFLDLLYKRESQNQLKEAIDIARKLIRIKPKLAAYQLRLARLYEKNKEHKLALKILYQIMDTAIFTANITPEIVRENIITLNYKLKNYLQVFKESIRLLQINEKNETGLVYLAYSYGGQGRLQEAMGYVQTALKTHQKSSQAHYVQGLILFDSGDVRNGVIAMETAVNMDKSNARAVYFLAFGLREAGFHDKANYYFNRLGIDPEKEKLSNISKAGLMKADVPKMDLDSLKDEVMHEKRKDSFASLPTASTLEELIRSSGEIFRNSVRHIIRKMHYTPGSLIEDHSLDTSSELCLTANDRNGNVYLVQFWKSSSPIGTIPVSNFLTRLENSNTNKGILLTTSTFSADAIRHAEQEAKIQIFDKDKLIKYLY